MAQESDAPLETPKPLAEIEHGPSKFEQFLDRNHKMLILVGSILVIAIAGTYLFTEIKQGQEEDAGGELVGALMAETPAESAVALQQVIAENSDKLAAVTAKVFLAQAQWDAGESAKAIETLKSFIAAHPDHESIGAALLKLANFQLAEGDQEAAKKTFSDIVNTPAASYAAPHALLVLGDLAAAAGNKEEAKSFYQRFRDEFPRANFTTANFDFIGQRMEMLDFQAPRAYTPEPPKEETPEEEKAEETPAVIPPAPEPPQEGNEEGDKTDTAQPAPVETKKKEPAQEIEAPAETTGNESQ